MIIGGMRDENGCCISCGYSYCESLAECLRPWERVCPQQGGHRYLQTIIMNFLVLCSNQVVNIFIN